MTQNDGTTRKFIRRRGLVQGRHVSESIQESTECIFEPSRYAYRLATYSGTALYSLGSHTPTHWSFLEIQRMNFHERILWSHMRGYYGLIWEDTMVSHERILWSHMRGYYDLAWEDTMVSHERILWSPMRGYYGLTWEDTMVSHERILWSPMRGYYGLIREDTMVYWWKMPSALCRMAGSGSGRFRASC